MNLDKECYKYKASLIAYFIYKNSLITVKAYFQNPELKKPMPWQTSRMGDIYKEYV